MIPQEVSELDMVFGGKVMQLLPKYEDIPREFKQFSGTKWNNVIGDWFFSGLKNAKWTPKKGINTNKALRHIKAVLGSWEPKHEHKEAGCAYLLSQFFEDVQYEKGK